MNKLFARAAFFVTAIFCYRRAPIQRGPTTCSRSRFRRRMEYTTPASAASDECDSASVQRKQRCSVDSRPRQIETADAQNPLGYLLEAEIDWWTIYCQNFEFRWNFLDVWHHPVEDAVQQSYLDLASRSISLAESRLEKQETAEMHLYAGMGYIMRGRLLACAMIAAAPRAQE